MCVGGRGLAGGMAKVSVRWGEGREVMSKGFV